MELFKLFGTIAVDNSAANNGIDETTDKAEKSHPKIAAAFEKVGAAAVKVGKIVASGLAVGSAAIGALAKSALGSYADYEQLVGGVETLFAESGAKVMGYAQNAYKTAGLSANEYMETVTSFSASLLQSLDGDTARAAAIANRAITDMSDNANKMGTDMAMIQNAYQGFAKQNFTMLDNLKLGYGGTKEEMGRLLMDAAKLKGLSELEALGWSQRGTSGDFALIIEAIGIIQDQIGITGTTAKEASSTISGSLASTKSAWKNLLTGFADGGQDLGILIDNLVESGTATVNNIVPRIAQTLSGISDALPQILTVIAAELPALMSSLLPGLISGAVALAVGLGQMIPSLVNMVFNDLPYLLSNALYQSTSPAVSSLGSLFLDIGEFWREVLMPAIYDVGGALGGLWGAVQPILAVFPALFAETTGITNGFDIFRNMCWMVEDALGWVANKISGVAAWISDHSEQIQDTIRGLWENVQYVWNTLGQPIWDLVQSAIEIVHNAFAERMPEIREFVENVFEDIGKFWNQHLKPCFEAIGSFIEDTLAPIFEEVFEGKIQYVIDSVFQYIKSLWNDVLKPVFTGITDFLTGVFSGDWEMAWDGIVETFKGIINLIPLALEGMINGAISMINDLITGINLLTDAVGIGEISLIPSVTLPKLEKGGILKKGQIGLLEGNGAEAVVPLDQNQAWISAVARDMETAIGGGNNEQTQRIIDLLEMLVDMLPAIMIEAFKSMRWDVNNREFARLVKAVE